MYLGSASLPCGLLQLLAGVLDLLGLAVVLISYTCGFASHATTTVRLSML